MLELVLHRSRLEVLLEPDRPIFEIAIASGFNSASHFSRAFVTEFGMTPTKMRTVR
ncbi:MAG: AraC family transcriptional regulator [Rhizobiaceae bacterium]|nr:AraC family transcriptional regulator [Rhizobiaceae bacterium]